MKFLIIGCGPTGLGAACKISDYLQKNPGANIQVLVIDREPVPGGLSRTVYDPQGFGWDCGVHVTFSTFGFYNEILDKALDTWKIHKRDVVIDLTSRYGPDARYPYPIQKSIPYFPEEVRQNCINDVRQLWKDREEKEKAGQSAHAKLETFEQFCMLSFGKTLCDVFFKPYNEKIWTTPFNKLSAEWVSARVAPVDLKDLEKKPEPVKDKTKEDHGWGPNAVFRYPILGGTGYIWDKVSQLLPPGWFEYERELQEVDLEKKTAKIRDLKRNEIHKYEYDHLITSIPLDIFGRCCVNPKLEPNLQHTSVIIVGVAVEDELPECLVGKTWFYFPDDSPFYRITVLSNYFNDCTPDNSKFYTLLCEISMVPNGHHVDLDDYAKRTVARLVKQGFVKEAKKVHHTHNFLLPYGYPIPTMQRDTELKKAHGILENKNVYSRGRFGGWKYEASNQDFSFMQGAEVAERILQGTPEQVYAWRN